MKGELFPEEQVMPVKLARIYAKYGQLILGPGPRNWTLVTRPEDGKSPGAQYRIIGVIGSRFRLRKVREWH